MSTPAIEISDLHVRYDGVAVLRGFGLTVARGEKVTLRGPSGCGKSTVLKCLLGLVLPQSGTVRVGGQQLDGRSVWDVRRQLAYVAQEPDLGQGTAHDALARPLSYRTNAAQQGNLDRLPALCERFLLAPSRLDKDVAELSGGEKQRVALIAALLLERPVLLLDEVTSALDPENRRAVATYLQEADELTVLAVSHDPEWLGAAPRLVDLPGPHDEGRP